MRLARAVVVGAGGWALGIGILVLAGWGSGHPALTRIVPVWPPMLPLVAVALALTGAALLLLSRQPLPVEHVPAHPPSTDGAPGRSAVSNRSSVSGRSAVLGRCAALVAAALSAGFLVQDMLGTGLGLDHLLFGAALDAAGESARPAPYPAVALLITAVALLLLDADRAGGYRPATVLGCLSAMVSIGALLGLVYGLSYVRLDAAYAGLAGHTAVTLLVLSAGILAARPDRPLVRAFDSATPGGRLARRLTPALLLVPFVIGLLTLAGQQRTDNPATAVTVTTLCAMAVLLAVVSGAARELDRVDRAYRSAETVLRGERDLTRALLGGLPDGVVVFGPDHRIRDVNPRWCALTGLPRAELIGRTPPFPWWGGDGMAEAVVFERFVRRGRPASAERLLRRPDGTEIPVLATIAQLRGRDDDRLAFVGVYSDITGLHQAEAKFAALLEGAPDAMIGVGPSGDIALLNARAERLFGYCQDDLLGKPVEVLLAPSSRPAHLARRAAYLESAAPGPVTGRLEVTCVRKDGTEFPADVSLSSIQTEDGLLVSAAVRDNSERLRNERALRAQQDHTRAILASASDAFVTIDPRGLVVDWNDAAEALFGWPAAEATGQPLADLVVPPPVRQAHRDGLRRLIGGGLPTLLGRRLEVTAVHRDGHEIPVELSIWRSETESGSRFHAFLRDITDRLALQAEREQVKAQAERERYERRLQQTQRLESLGQLAGGVAHDFNNLLAVIVNYLDFVAEEVSAAAAEDGARWDGTRRDIEQIQRATERATRLVRQLLAFGRRDIVKPEVLDLNRVVADLTALLGSTVGEHIDVLTDLAPGLWPLRADSAQIEQVLVNLAVNAGDAMPNGGTLTIDTANLTLGGDQASDDHLPEGRYVRLRVSDTGQGMTKDVAERAFEPFYTTKPKGTGTGLGLATVYGILAQAGGHGQISSEPGIGTTITALLPATAEVPAADTAPAQRPAGRDGATVLVIEDEDALREVVRRILTRNGYRVLVAASGPEAIELARGHQGTIDMVLSDVVMPQMLGKEAVARIREIRPGIRVIYMSGYAQPVLAAQGTLDDGVTLVAKPFAEGTLLESLQRKLAEQPAD
jgi:PAS domain S-box-containing protein